MTDDSFEKHESDQRDRSKVLENFLASDEGQSDQLASISAYLQIVAGKLLEQDPLLAGRIRPSDLVQETFTEILSDPRFGDLSRTRQFDGLDLEKLTTRMWLKLNELGRTVRAIKRSPLRERPLPSANRSVDDPELYSDDASPTPRRAGEPLLPSSMDPQQKTIQADDIQNTLAALSELPEEYQQVIQMRDLQQLSFAEIAQQMQRSEEAVRKLWKRALVKLQKHLGAR